MKSEIEAGPALDALVAEHVKGWIKSTQGKWYANGKWVALEGGHNAVWSSSPRLALQLLVEENRRRLDDGLWLLHYRGIGYVCAAPGTPNRDEGFPAPEVAICRGILEAHGVDVEAALKEQ